MTLRYPEALPLRDDLREGHAAAWADIAQPGVSWTGAERVAILAEARAALHCNLCTARKSALSPNAVEGDHDIASALAAAIVDGIHRLRTDPQRLTRAWFDSLVPDQLSQPAYAELVSVVCTSVIIDTQHNALGLPVTELPDPIEGEPGGDLLDDTVDIGAWLPVMKAEADLADTGLPSVPNIARAMSLVPSAAALFFGAFRPHYRLQKIPLAISQAQAEFIASRVSALNQCFYWTTSHTMLLRASGEQSGAEYDLSAVTSTTGDAGVEHESLLRELTEAAIENRWDDLEDVRRRATQTMGEQETVDALTVAAAFNGITRVADATGIPLDEHTAATTVKMRDATGIDQFDYAEKSARYSATGG